MSWNENIKQTYDIATGVLLLLILPVVGFLSLSASDQKAVSSAQNEQLIEIKKDLSNHIKVRYHETVGDYFLQKDRYHQDFIEIKRELRDIRLELKEINKKIHSME